MAEQDRDENQQPSEPSPGGPPPKEYSDFAPPGEPLLGEPTEDDLLGEDPPEPEREDPNDVPEGYYESEDTDEIVEFGIIRLDTPVSSFNPPPPLEEGPKIIQLSPKDEKFTSFWGKVVAGFVGLLGLASLALVVYVIYRVIMWYTRIV